MVIFVHIAAEDEITASPRQVTVPGQVTVWAGYFLNFSCTAVRLKISVCAM
jgi:hypothetical protein